MPAYDPALDTLQGMLARFYRCDRVVVDPDLSMPARMARCRYAPSETSREPFGDGMHGVARSDTGDATWAYACRRPGERTPSFLADGMGGHEGAVAA